MIGSFFSGKKLWRNPQRGMIKGVCAGIADYFDVPVKLVRAIALLSLVLGLFVFTVALYIILSVLLDPRPEGAEVSDAPRSNREWLRSIDQQLADGEQRLRTMERYVTSDTYTVRSRFHQL